MRFYTADIRVFTQVRETFDDITSMSEANDKIVPSVIIADDSPEICMVLKRTLEICDCNVIATAENGKIALELIEQHKPDMVFLDIEMPVKNGFEVLDIIKERNIEVCSVMLTGHSSKENLLKSVQKGALGFIVKPHTQEKVEDIVASYMKSRKG